MEQRRQRETSFRNETTKIRAVDKIRLMRAKELKSKLELIKDEIQRRKDGLQKEIEGIQASKELSEEKKQRLVGQAMQRQIVSPEFVNIMLDICDRLDKLMLRVGQ